MAVIGIMGRIGTGKNYTTECLVNTGISSAFTSFAAPLKEVAKAMGFDIKDCQETKQRRVMIYDFDDKLFEALKILKLNDMDSANVYATAVELFNDEYMSIDHHYLSPRDFYMSFGTDVIRKMFPDLWVNMAREYIKEVKESIPDINIILSDVRFKNEANICDVIVYLTGHSDIMFMAHESEKQYDKIAKKYEAKVVKVNNIRGVDKFSYGNGVLNAIREVVPVTVGEGAILTK